MRRAAVAMAAAPMTRVEAPEKFLHMAQFRLHLAMPVPFSNIHLSLSS